MLVETYAGVAPLLPAKKLVMDARVPVECSPIFGTTRCLRCRLAGPLRSSSINGVVNVKPLSNCTCCRSPAGIIRTSMKVTQTANVRRGTYVSTNVRASWRRGRSILGAKPARPLQRGGFKNSCFDERKNPLESMQVRSGHWGILQWSQSRCGGVRPAGDREG